MNPSRLRPVLSAAVLLLAALGSSPSPAAGSELAGRVLSPAGIGLPDALIRVLPDGPVTRSGEEGRFTLEVTGDTSLLLEVRALGCEDLVLRVEPGDRSRTLFLRMQPRGEAVVVQAFREQAPVLGALEAEDLAPERVRTPTEAVATVPGGSPAGKGGHENVPAVRGMARGRTLLVVENARITSERRVGVSASFLPSGFLAGVDVIRGARGTLNGSDAEGGVVRVSLVDPTGLPGPGVVTTLSASTRGHGVEPTVLAEYGWERWSVLAGFAHRDYEDYEAGGDAGTVESSGVLDRSTWLRLRRRTDRNLFEIGWLHGDADHVGRPDNRWPGRVGYVPTEDRDLLTAHWTRGLGNGRVLELSGTFLQRDSKRVTEVFRDDGTRNRTEAARDRSRDLNLRGAWALERERYRFQVGADVLVRSGITGDNRVVRFPPGGPAEVVEETPIADGGREDVGVFAAVEIWPVEQLTLDLGLRGDSVDTDVPLVGDRNESDWSGHFGVRWQETPWFGMGVIAGRAFRTPGVYELFYSGLSGRGVVYGNPDLPKESAQSLEFWLGGGETRARWEARLWQTDLEDFTDRISQGDEFFLISRPEARLRGAELAASVGFGDGWTMRGSAQRMEGEDRATGETLNDLPADRFTLDLSYARRRWSLGGSLLGAADIDDPGSEERPVGGYLLVGLRGRFDLGGGYSLSWTAENLLDQEWYANADNRGVPGPGRAVSVTVRYSLRDADAGSSER